MKTVWINGSPKKKMSVSGHLLGLVRMMVRGEHVLEQVRTPADHARVLQALIGADAVVFGLPLYVDGVPAHMLAFLQAMELFCRENGLHLRVYVLSNGGFIEGNQNRALMRVLENFCTRSGLSWCGGVGVGGGVMLNVLRILLFVYLGMLGVNILLSGLMEGVWLPQEALMVFAQQLGMILFFHLGFLFYGIRLGVAVNRGKGCGVHFTRVMLPSFLFILAADLFFVITSVFQGGLFRGWLARK